LHEGWWREELHEMHVNNGSPMHSYHDTKIVVLIQKEEI
jgi:hypothetical protein